MFVAVKFLIHRRAAQPEIRAQINDHTPELQQWHGELRRHAMRQGEKDDVRLLGQQFGIRLGKPQQPGPRMTGKTGNICATVWPAFWRDVTAVNSTPGWFSSRPTSSSPE